MSFKTAQEISRMYGNGWGRRLENDHTLTECLIEGFDVITAGTLLRIAEALEAGDTTETALKWHRLYLLHIRPVAEALKAKENQQWKRIDKFADASVLRSQWRFNRVYADITCTYTGCTSEEEFDDRKYSLSCFGRAVTQLSRVESSADLRILTGIGPKTAKRATREKT